jgi:hypothetical protein
MELYDTSRSTVVESIRKASSKLTISFDGWKANNEVLDVLHYLNSDYMLQTVIIGMRDTMRSHTGATIGDHLADVLSDFEIEGHQIAYFAADNATNNDTALEQLNKHLPVNKVTQRLRYAGHIYNLVCNAILHGVDEEASQDASQSAREVDSAGITDFDTTLRNGGDEEQLIV